MSALRRCSTCTVRDDGRIVPWLAASGPLSYTPENPPTSDYYFQYGWVLAGILAPAMNRRRHFYFGECVKQHTKELFAFWRMARAGSATPIGCHLGGVTADTRVTAPVAVYSMRDARDRSAYLFMQHGSHQLVPTDEQPLLRSGEVTVYRGVQSSTAFRFLHVDHRNLDAGRSRVWRSYVRTQLRMLSDSVLSFSERCPAKPQACGERRPGMARRERAVAGSRGDPGARGDVGRGVKQLATSDRGLGRVRVTRNVL